MSLVGYYLAQFVSYSGSSRGMNGIQYYGYCKEVSGGMNNDVLKNQIAEVTGSTRCVEKWLRLCWLAVVQRLL